MHKSVATLDSPEFINLQPLDINPLMSKCEIKVLYTGNNQHPPYTKDYIEQLPTSCLKWSKDDNECYLIWGWPGPDFNIYNRSNYKREWGYSTEERDGSVYLR